MGDYETPRAALYLRFIHVAATEWLSVWHSVDESEIVFETLPNYTEFLNKSYD